MYPNSILSVVIIVAISSLVMSNDNGPNEPFKINKLNLIWTKAQHSLGSAKLKDLKIDLLRHEVDELSLKKMKALNQDKDGLVEAAVRKKLLIIMTKYALERFYDDVHPPVPVDGNSYGKDYASEHVAKLPTFRDGKLNKLWKKAEKSGLSHEQLMILHEEFQNQQNKLDGHYETMNAIEDEIKKLKKTRNDNSLESDIEDARKKKAKSRVHETPSEKKARLESNVHQGLKDKHTKIKKGFEDLHKKISTGVMDEDRPFEDDIVNDLWATALKSNFSPPDLESLKEELEHYQTRVKKLKHFQNQLERYENGSKESSSYSEDNDEVKHIRKRVDELGRKVEKAHNTIENMIKKRRDEL